MKNPVPLLFVILGLNSALAAPTDRTQTTPDDHPGKRIYQELCVECHGDRGEGGGEVDPLVGDRPIPWLARRIERTMPDDNEQACVGEDARQVADYIYHAFYSPESRIHSAGQSRELSHLTGTQFENSVADLIASFLPATKQSGAPSGLVARYLANGVGGTKERSRLLRLTRSDPVPDVGPSARTAPLPTEFEETARRMRVVWRGTLVAPETGEYELVIRSGNKAKLFLNANRTPLLELNEGENGDIGEQRARIRLLAGRPYLFRVLVLKTAHQTPSFALLWKPPQGKLELMPTTAFRPFSTAAPLFIPDKGMPADDLSMGFERGTLVSSAWLEAVMTTAFKAADHVVNRLEQLSDTRTDAPDHAEKIGAFAREFAARAYRRPLTAEEAEASVAHPLRETGNEREAIRQLVLKVITSPLFLYPDLAFTEQDTSWARASALALALWDSLPDRALRQAAATDSLQSEEAIRQQARRMLADGRAHAKVRNFFHQWLQFDRAEEVAKDGDKYPEYSNALLADQRTSLDLFLDEVFWGSDSDYRSLFLADYLYLNPSLSRIYGASNETPGFHKNSLSEQGRAGVITHPFLLTVFAYNDNSSPIHRGVFLTRNIVGLPLKPPPAMISFKDKLFDPTFTMREKITELTSSKACMSCHATINPLGFSLEHFDAIGRWRNEDNHKPVDDHAVFETQYGEPIQLNGPRGVARYAANSPTAQRAFVRRMISHVGNQPFTVLGLNRIQELEQGFEKKQFHMRDLWVEIAVAFAQIAATRP